MISTWGRLFCTQPRHWASDWGWAKSFLIWSRGQSAHEAMLHRQNDLRHDFQIAIHEHVQRVGHYAFSGILDRDHAIIRAALADFGKDVGNGLLRAT